MTESAAARLAPPIWLLALAVSGANVGMSLLAPAILSLRQDLGASADEAQLVLSVFLVMLGLGQLGAGSLSDRIGRRPVLVYGSLLFLLAGVGSLMAPNVEVLIVLRALQGVGAATCMAMGRVIINDSFDRNEAGRQLSTITMAQSVVPLLGFAFGGLLADIIGWRGSIGLMVFVAILIFIGAALLIRETHINRPPPATLGAIIQTYGRLLVTPVFIGHATSGAMLTAAFFAMGGFMPYQFERLGASAFEFGLFFSATPLGYMTGNSLNRSLGPRIGLERAAFYGALISVATISTLLASHLVGVASEGVIALHLFFYGLANGMVIANIIICAVRAAGPHSGAATGLCGALQMAGSAIGGVLIIAAGGDQNFTMALGFIWVMSAVALAASWLVKDRTPIS